MDRAQQARLVRLAGFALPIVALGVLFAILAVYFERGFVPGDSFTYLAAGERLNAGHPLYALSPGDRPVELHPPYWTVPLLSPPLVAVLARPFALLSDAGAYLWWACCLASIGLVVVGLLRARPVAGSVALLALVVPLVYEIGVGNVNGLLLGAACAVWLLARRGGFGRAGVLAVFAVGIKVTPFPLAGWVAGAGGRAGFRSVVLGGVLAGAASLLGAGLATHVDYLAVVRTTNSSGLTPLSAGGLALALGLPAGLASLAPTLVLAAGAIAAGLLARAGFVGAGWAVAVAAWTFGTPVLNINTPVILLAALAPLAWPWPRRPALALSEPSTVAPLAA